MSEPEGPASVPTLPPDADDEAFGAGATSGPTPGEASPAEVDEPSADSGPSTADTDATDATEAAEAAQAAAPAGEGADVVSDEAGAAGEPGEGEAAGQPCATCGEPLVGTAKFCEACGAPVGGAEVSTSPASGAEPDEAAPPCTRCGAEVGDDGYCTSCGHRALEPVMVDDRGAAAYATHRGRRHNRNEDAAALATTSEGWPVLVVSDGVSVSPNPHKASAAAVEAAATRLAGRPFAGDDDLVAAVELAHEAASGVPGTGDPNWVDDGTHPACTIVVAVVTPTDAHMANVGDARGYVLTATTPAEAEAQPGTEPAPAWSATQLTIDDSVAAEAVAEGVDPDVALTLEGGHAITAWLGADATGVEVHLATHPVGPADVVLVSSDGLWNYATTDAALGGLASAHLHPPATPPGALGPVCEALVTWANGRGGADNITVTIAHVPAEDGGAEGEEPE